MKGIFVAFDEKGRHYAYAKHWDDAVPADALIAPADREREVRDQKRAIEAMSSEARQRGGEVTLLTPAEYADIVLGKTELAHSPVPAIPLKS